MPCIVESLEGVNPKSPALSPKLGLVAVAIEVWEWHLLPGRDFPSRRRKDRADTAIRLHYCHHQASCTP